MADWIKVTHKACGGDIGIMNGVDDTGEFEIICPNCKEWVEIQLCFLCNPEEFGVESEEVTYEDVSTQYR